MSAAPVLSRLDRVERLPAPLVRTVDARCALAESPLWLPGSGLVWVDADRDEVQALAGPGGPTASWPATTTRAAGAATWPVGATHRRVAPALAGGGPLSAVNATGDGALLLTAGRRVWRAARTATGTGPPRLLAELAPDPPGVRCNDARVGPDGRLWIGTVSPGRSGGGALWSMDGDGRLRRHWGGISHGNGIGWSPCGDTVFVVDSGAGTLSRAAFDRAAGPGDPTVILRIDPSVGIPDGLAVAADGTLWLAVWGGNCLLRLAPDGTVTGRVELSERNVTSCAFAGAQLTLLAVTTAADDVDPGGPGGGVHLLDVGGRGRPTDRLGTADPTGGPIDGGATDG
ncbi:SMP-30/gluconolactonase/LRE family protein [Solwaraspora sp. WMMB335]|uniref:SMP-30/gluconolactonase/LRE family protein n=1 Tax=Solwaraspora sp. WMMB335 TaxID=3404118 RepID=UPI003B93D027